MNGFYAAKECVLHGIVRCGDFVTGGDGRAFAADCRRAHRSALDVARSLRYWARRALAQGRSWRVYTWTAAGGYPYSCRFGVVKLRV